MKLSSEAAESSSRLTVRAEDLEEDAASEFQQLRKELLKDTKEANARMVSVMQASAGDPMAFLPEARPGGARSDSTSRKQQRK